MASAKFCTDMIPYNEDTLKPNLPSNLNYYGKTVRETGIAQLCDLYVPFSLYYYNFMCPSMWKRKKMEILCAFWNLNALKD